MMRGGRTDMSESESKLDELAWLSLTKPDSTNIEELGLTSDDIIDACDLSNGRVSFRDPEEAKARAIRHIQRAVITPAGEDWCVTAEGYDAMGMKRPEVARTPTTFEAELDKVIADAEAKWKQAATGTPRTRANSKQAEVLRMLQRSEGATIAQICEATGWQAHTVRGTFSGAFKKKMGLAITSENAEGGERVYRVPL